VATAPPTNPLENAFFFMEQVNELVKKHLTDEGRYLVPHFDQSLGYLLMSIIIFRMNGGEREGFQRFVRDAWKEAEANVEMVLTEEEGK
jgi:hypothetical protein